MEMDKELMEMLTKLKFDSKVLVTLVDTILDNCDLDYGKTLRFYDSGNKVLNIIKTFFPDEAKNRLEQLLEEAKKEESNNG